MLDKERAKSVMSGYWESKYSMLHHWWIEFTMLKIFSLVWEDELRRVKAIADMCIISITTNDFLRLIHMHMVLESKHIITDHLEASLHLLKVILDRAI